MTQLPPTDVNRQERRHPGRRLLGIPEVMQELNLSRTTIFALIKDGKLFACKAGRRRLVPVEAVNAYVESLISEANDAA